MTKKKKGRNKNAQERAARAGAVWDAASAEKSRADPHTSADVASAGPKRAAPRPRSTQEPRPRPRGLLRTASGRAVAKDPKEPRAAVPK